MHGEFVLNSSCSPSPFPQVAGADDPKAQAHKGAYAALRAWAAAIGTGNPTLVTELYAHDAILVPTLSDDLRGTQETRRAYFETFLTRKELACRIDTFESRVSAKVGTVVIGGLYTFTYVKDDGAPACMVARYLFTFEQIDDVWLITGHHSSKVSESGCD